MIPRLVWGQGCSPPGTGEDLLLLLVAAALIDRCYKPWPGPGHTHCRANGRSGAQWLPMTWSNAHGNGEGLCCWRSACSPSHTRGQHRDTLSCIYQIVQNKDHFELALPVSFSPRRHRIHNSRLLYRFLIILNSRFLYRFLNEEILIAATILGGNGFSSPYLFLEAMV